MTDHIDALAGITSGSAGDALRRRRPRRRDGLQAAYDALFAPLEDGEFEARERVLIAAFATRLTSDDATAASYARRAVEAEPSSATVVLDEAAANTTRGPYGRFFEEGLAGESTDGPRYHTSDPVRSALGDRLAAALEFTHLLTYRPREADASALERLIAAGWSTDGIVTLSQLITFLAMQQRIAAGLNVLNTTIQKEAAA